MERFIQSLSDSETVPADFHFVSPEEVGGNAGKYAQIIAAIVNECYGSEYPAPTRDSSYLVSALNGKSQLSAVWSLNPQTRDADQYGTLSLYDAGFPFGPNIGELGKSGSPSDGGAKYGFALFERHWRESHARGLKYRSFFCTSRNCGSRPAKEGRVRAGAAVRYLVARVMRMTQWGYAPWYLMPDTGSGSYELLDFFVRLPDDVDRHPSIASTTVHVASAAAARFVEGVFTSNWGFSPRLAERRDAAPAPPVGWSLLEEDYQQQKNPVKLLVGPGKETFEAAFDRLENLAGSTAVVVLPLTEAYLAAQATVEGRGYTLCAVYPPTRLDAPVQGMWCRLNSSNPIIPPKHQGNPDGACSPWLSGYIDELLAALVEHRRA
ncbi:hypothetical protein SAMN02982985_00228 [Rugamonas rubra]|uniref:Uncharacterized protein n=2 Tax=Rugamonas rubra TaxID=758825 RepID=A0A1I4HTR3_9BURK|nr:hypothetical protein SAMN02982985_00228 [Rugamonas rubra]